MLSILDQGQACALIVFVKVENELAIDDLCKKFMFFQRENGKFYLTCGLGIDLVTFPAYEDDPLIRWYKFT